MKFLLLILNLMFLTASLFAGCIPPQPLENLTLRANAPGYAERGSFAQAAASEQQVVSQKYVEDAKNGKLEEKFSPDEVKRVFGEDAALDLTALNADELLKLEKIGLEKVKELYLLTSGAGLWSRGGGVVKALVPKNLKALLSINRLDELVLNGKIINMSKLEEVMAATKIKKFDDGLNVLIEQLNLERKADGLPLIDLKKRPLAEIEKEIGIKLSKENMLGVLQEGVAAKIRNTIKPIVYNPDAINALDLKFVNAALLSKRGKTYVPFDIWTSEQTHGQIRDYLWWLRDNYRVKTFHPDFAMDKQIKEALGDYFSQSTAKGQTHLLGHQEGFKAMDLNGKYIEGTPEIGAGAGMYHDYLKTSGRMDELKGMGKNTVMFDNIEVVNDDVLLLLAGRSLAKTPVTVVLVDQKEGYKGGNAFKILNKKTGKWDIQLREQSSLDKSFSEGNELFNSNTIISSFDVRPSSSTAYELKKRQVRVKKNAGDATLDNETSVIKGRIGKEYENFKDYKEYSVNGEARIGASQKSWEENLRLISQPSKRVLNIGSGTNPMSGAINLEYDFEKAAKYGAALSGDANHLPFKNGVFDEVHIINPYGFDAVTPEISRVMKPGGTLKVSGAYETKAGKDVGNKYARPTSSDDFDLVDHSDVIDPAHNYGVQRNTKSGAPINPDQVKTTTYKKKDVEAQDGK